MNSQKNTRDERKSVFASLFSVKINARNLKEILITKNVIKLVNYRVGRILYAGNVRLYKHLIY